MNKPKAPVVSLRRYKMLAIEALDRAKPYLSRNLQAQACHILNTVETKGIDHLNHYHIEAAKFLVESADNHQHA